MFAGSLMLFTLDYKSQKGPKPRHRLCSDSMWVHDLRVASWYLPSYLGWRRAIERLGENFTPKRCLQIT
jgi:hypothetical protein